MKLKEIFDGLNSFIEKDFKETRWSPKVAYQSLESMDFKKWELSFDDEKNNSFPSFWIHENGLYALLDKSKINMVVLSNNLDFDLGKKFKGYQLERFVTPYGFSIAEHQLPISSFEGLHNFSNLLPSIKHTLPKKNWLPVIINSMAEKLAEVKQFGVAYFKDAISIYIDECKDDEVKLKNQANDFLKQSKIHRGFDTSSNTSLLLDYKVIQTIKGVMPTWYTSLATIKTDILVKEKDVLLISDFLHGKEGVSWEMVVQKTKGVHPLLWILEFMIGSNSDKLNENITSFSYKIIDDIAKKLSASEIKEIWEYENRGQALFFNSLIKNQKNLLKIQCFFDILIKNLKLDFLDDSIFNFRKLFKDAREYQFSILGGIPSETTTHSIHSILPEFFRQTPELLKSKEESLISFLSDVEKESPSVSFVVGNIIKKIIHEKELLKELTPISSSIKKGPRF